MALASDSGHTCHGAAGEPQRPSSGLVSTQRAQEWRELTDVCPLPGYQCLKKATRVQIDLDLDTHKYPWWTSTTMMNYKAGCLSVVKSEYASSQDGLVD